MRRITILIVIALGLTLVGGLAVSANGSTLYVDGTEGTDEEDCGTSTGTGACATIQYAIGEAEAGDTIEVAAGTYEENLTVYVEGLTLEGPFAGVPGHDTGRNPGEAVISGTVRLEAQNVTVDGFEIAPTEATVAAVQGWPEHTWDGVTIQNNRVLCSPAPEGISNYIRLGIWLQPQLGGDSYAQGASILDNYVGGEPTQGGMDVFGIDTGAVVGNHVIFDGESSSLVGDPTKQEYGIWAMQHKDLDLSENLVKGWTTGLLFEGNTDSTASDNQFEDNYTGLWRGDFRQYKWAPTDPWEELDYQVSAAGCDIRENDFIANHIQLRDETREQYGHAAAAVENPLDLDVVLDNNTLDRAAVVRGSGIKVPVIFSSIQDAIDAADPGDTVEVAAGTYNEDNIAVSKPVTIRSTDGAANTIIQAVEPGNVFVVGSGRWLQVNDPASLGGGYSATGATFGPQPGDPAWPVTAEVAYAEPALGDGAIGNVEGKIALIDRGDVPFTDKVENAQQGGAVGVIIANTDDDLTIMGASAGYDDQITIPIIMIKASDADAIKAELEADTVNATLDAPTGDVIIQGFTIKGRTPSEESTGFSGSVNATDVCGLRILDNVFQFTGSPYFTRVTDFDISGNQMVREYRENAWYRAAGAAPGTYGHTRGGEIVQLWHCDSGLVEGNVGFSPGVTMFNYSSNDVDYIANTVEAPDPPLQGDDGIADYAMSIQSSDNVKVMHNTFTGIVGQHPYPSYNHGKAGAALYFNHATGGQITGNTFESNTIGVKVRYPDEYDGDTVVLRENSFLGNDYSVFNHRYSRIDSVWTILQAKVEIDARQNYWGSPDGPIVVPVPDGGETWGAFWDVIRDSEFPERAVSDMVTFQGWIDADGNIIIPSGTSKEDAQAIIDSAPAGATIVFEGGGYAGGYNVGTSGLTFNLNGSTIGAGSPAFTIAAADVTIAGPGTLDGNGSDPAILVTDGGDNFTLKNVEVRNWAAGVEVDADVESFKIVGNWFHDNDVGLLIDSTVTLNGVVKIEGNLFKDNNTFGIDHNGEGTLPATYNSWGDAAGPTGGNGDGFDGDVTVDPWTFAEVFLDVDPDTGATERDVNEDDTFEVALKVEAAGLYAVEYTLTYSDTLLTLNGDPTAGDFVGDHGSCTVDTASNGEVSVYCTRQTPDVDASGTLTVSTLSFTADLPDIDEDADGPWINHFDIAHAAADTNAGAQGGIKVYVNNAGFGNPSDSARDITDDDDGQINITGLANFTGFIALQGRTDDSGATINVYSGSTIADATAWASGTSAAGGAYTTSYIGDYQLLVGETYHFQVNRDLFLPTTAVMTSTTYSPLPTEWQNNGDLDTRPLTQLAMVELLGGDATNDDLIDIDDATCIGTDYGGAPSVCGTDGSSDVNADGKVDLLDLVLMAGNYDKTSSPWKQ